MVTVVGLHTLAYINIIRHKILHGSGPARGHSCHGIDCRGFITPLGPRESGLPFKCNLFCGLWRMLDSKWVTQVYLQQDEQKQKANMRVSS